MNEDLINKLKDDDNFQSFMDFALAKANELESIGKYVDELSNERAGEEAKIRRQAAETIREIFYQFTRRDREDHSIEDIQKVKERVGL